MSSVTSLDTAQKAQNVQTAILKHVTPQARVQMAVSMSEDAREIARCGIRHRHPDWDEARVRHELLVRLYGADVVARAWGTPVHE